MTISGSLSAVSMAIALLVGADGGSPAAVPTATLAPGHVWGDVNEDGVVNILDSRQILRYSVGLRVVNPAAVIALGDVTADGVVDIMDAQQIARYSVGLTASTRVDTPSASFPGSSLAKRAARQRVPR